MIIHNAHGFPEIFSRMAYQPLLHGYPVPGYLHNLAYRPSFRPAKNCYSLDPCISGIYNILHYSDMENQNRGEGKGVPEHYICYNLQSSVNSRYSFDQLSQIQVQMDIQNRKHESSCSWMLSEDGRLYDSQSRR